MNGRSLMGDRRIMARLSTIVLFVAISLIQPKPSETNLIRFPQNEEDLSYMYGRDMTENSQPEDLLPKRAFESDNSPSPTMDTTPFVTTLPPSPPPPSTTIQPPNHETTSQGPWTPMQPTPRATFTKQDIKLNVNITQAPSKPNRIIIPTSYTVQYGPTTIIRQTNNFTSLSVNQKGVTLPPFYIPNPSPATTVKPRNFTRNLEIRVPQFRNTTRNMQVPNLVTGRNFFTHLPPMPMNDSMTSETFGIIHAIKNFLDGDGKKGKRKRKGGGNRYIVQYMPPVMFPSNGGSYKSYYMQPMGGYGSKGNRDRPVHIKVTTVPYMTSYINNNGGNNYGNYDNYNNGGNHYNYNGNNDYGYGNSGGNSYGSNNGYSNAPNSGYTEGDNGYKTGNNQYNLEDGRHFDAPHYENPPAAAPNYENPPPAAAPPQVPPAPPPVPPPPPVIPETGGDAGNSGAGITDHIKQVKNYDTLFRGFVLDFFMAKYKLQKR